MGIDALGDRLKWEETQRVRQARQEAEMMQAAKLAQLLATTEGVNIGNAQQALKQKQMEFAAPMERRNALVENLGAGVGANASIAADPKWNTETFQPSAIPMRHPSPLGAQIAQQQDRRFPGDVAPLVNPQVSGDALPGDVQGTLPEVARMSAERHYNMGMDNTRKANLEAETYPFKKDLQQTADAAAMERTLVDTASRENIAAGHDRTIENTRKDEADRYKRAVMNDINNNSRLLEVPLMNAVTSGYALMQDEKQSQFGADEKIKNYTTQMQSLSSQMFRYKSAMDADIKRAVELKIDPSFVTNSYAEMLRNARATYDELKKRHDREMAYLRRGPLVNAADRTMSTIGGLLGGGGSETLNP
jgi:hypothetical protein